MAGREMTPSEIQDKQYNDLITWGCVAIGFFVLCLLFYVAMTPEAPRDVYYLNFDSKKLNDVDYSSKDVKTMERTPTVLEPGLLKQNHSNTYYQDPEEHKLKLEYQDD